MAQKYRMAVTAVKIVLSAALMVTIFFTEVEFWIKKAGTSYRMARFQRGEKGRMEGKRPVKISINRVVTSNLS